MPRDYLPKGMTKEDMDNLSDDSKKILGRAKAGVPPLDYEVEKLADDIVTKGRRAMFDSPTLQRQLHKLKNRK